MTYLFLAIIYWLPAPLFAAPAPTDFKSFVGLINGLITIIIPLIFTLTLLTFMWGVIKVWILNGSDADEIDKGKKLAVAGIVAFVVMSSIWGIVSLLRWSFFGI